MDARGKGKGGQRGNLDIRSPPKEKETFRQKEKNFLAGRVQFI
jgi:hypothetical protein